MVSQGLMAIADLSQKYIQTEAQMDQVSRGEMAIVDCAFKEIQTEKGEGV